MTTSDKFYTVIGGLFGTLITMAVLCIPLWWLWNKLAPIYFYWLPPVYLALPFWHVVGLMFLIVTITGLLRRKS